MLKPASLVAAILFLAGCATFLSQKDLEGRYGTKPPVVTAIHVADYLTSPEPPRVYLEAQDPDGDLAVINYVIDPGGPHPTSYGAVFVGRRDARELSGYLWLETKYQDYFARFRRREVRGTLYLEDRAGHLSKPVNFSIKGYGLMPPEAESTGELARFKANALGPMRFELDFARE